MIDSFDVCIIRHFIFFLQFYHRPSLQFLTKTNLFCVLLFFPKILLLVTQFHPNHVQIDANDPTICVT